MLQSSEDVRLQKGPPWLKYVKYAGLALMVLITLTGGLYALFFVRVVPPISLKFVDAITGKQVPGMNVCLAVGVRGGGVQVLRQEISKSNVSGRAFFWPSMHNLFLGGWDGYRVQVTDPQTEFAPECSLGPGWNIPDNNPWPLYLGKGENGTPKYFPLGLVKRGDFEIHDLEWSTMRRTLGFPLLVRVPLIPVIEDIESCKQIQDRSLAEDCRQLNTYAAAMSLRENQDVGSRKRARELCQQVDHSVRSAGCRGRLDEFAMLLGAKHFRGDYSRTADVPARLTEDLFPGKVAGVSRTNASIYDNGSLGTGRRGYSATYSQQQDSPAFIGAQIEEFPNMQWAKERLDELPGGFADHAPGTVHEEEMIPGQKIERHRGSKYSGAFWVSGNRVVLITFYQPFAREDEFVTAFLTRFPSSL